MNKLHKLLSLSIVFAFIASLTLTQTVNATGWEEFDYWDVDTSCNGNPYFYNPSGTGWYLTEYEDQYIDASTGLTSIYDDLFLLDWSVTETDTYNDGTIGRLLARAYVSGDNSIKYGYTWTGPGDAPGASIDYSYMNYFETIMYFGNTGGASGDYMKVSCYAEVSPEFLAYESSPGETYYYDTRYGLVTAIQYYGTSHSYSCTIPTTPTPYLDYSVSNGIANLHIAWYVEVEDEIELDYGQDEFYMQATCDTITESISRMQLENGIEAECYAYTETLTAVIANMDIE